MEKRKTYFSAPGIKTIEEEAAEIWEIPVELLYKQTRKRQAVEARQILMVYYAKKFKKEGAKHSEEKATAMFNKNRTTIYHARKTIATLLNSDKGFTEKYNLFYSAVN